MQTLADCDKKVMMVRVPSTHTYIFIYQFVGAPIKGHTPHGAQQKSHP